MTKKRKRLVLWVEKGQGYRDRSSFISTTKKGLEIYEAYFLNDECPLARRIINFLAPTDKPQKVVVYREE